MRGERDFVVWLGSGHRSTIPTGAPSGRKVTTIVGGAGGIGGGPPDVDVGEAGGPLAERAKAPEAPPSGAAGAPSGTNTGTVHEPAQGRAGAPGSASRAGAVAPSSRLASQTVPPATRLARDVPASGRSTTEGVRARRGFTPRTAPRTGRSSRLASPSGR